MRNDNGIHLAGPFDRRDNDMALIMVCGSTLQTRSIRVRYNICTTAYGRSITGRFTIPLRDGAHVVDDRTKLRSDVLQLIVGDRQTGQFGHLTDGVDMNRQRLFGAKKACEKARLVLSSKLFQLTRIEKNRST